MSIDHKVRFTALKDVTGGDFGGALRISNGTWPAVRAGDGKVGIKRMDRLIGNWKLRGELATIYGAIPPGVCGQIRVL